MTTTKTQLELFVTAERFYSLAAGMVLALGMWFQRSGPISLIDTLTIAAAPLLVGAQLAAGQRVPRWPLVLALPVLISSVWSYDPASTFFTGLRWLSLAWLAIYIARVGDLRAVGFGILMGAVLVALPSSALGLTGRTAGLAPTISLLGLAGFGLFMAAPASNRWLKWAVAACGAVCIAASGARSPALAAAIGGLARGRWWIGPVAMLTLLFVLYAAQQGALYRLFDKYVLDRNIEERAATAGINIAGENYDLRINSITQQGLVEGPDGLILFGDERSIWGLGANAYAAANGWPRPHNIYLLAWEELGLMLAGPLLVLGWSLWRRSLPIAALLAILVYGVLDDSLLSQLGHYAIATVLLVHYMERRRCQSQI